MSLCTLDEGVAAALEPGAPPPAERLVLVRALAAEGVDVGISLAPWIPGVTDVAAVLDAVGPERRITISPLKCNAAGPTLELAGRRYTQQSVNGRYRHERERFRGCPSLRWESPWQFSNHYLRSYLPLTFGDVDGSIRSPEPEPRMAQRFLGLLAAHGVWHRVARGHAALYRASRGHLGRRAAGITYLLLITRGRRSGRPHTVPLPYTMDGPRWLVVASNGGADRDPAWLHNLRADTSATVQVGRARTEVTARVATTSQTRRLWPMLQSANPLLGRSQQLTARSLPVVILEPRGEAGERRASLGAGSLAAAESGRYPCPATCKIRGLHESSPDPGGNCPSDPPDPAARRCGGSRPDRAATASRSAFSNVDRRRHHDRGVAG